MTFEEWWKQWEQQDRESLPGWKWDYDLAQVAWQAAQAAQAAERKSTTFEEWWKIHHTDDAYLAALEAWQEQAAEVERLTRSTRCGLCHQPETSDNAIFHCCENCTDIGVSRVPKEVFTLQRECERLRAELEQLFQRMNKRVGELDDTNRGLRQQIAAKDKAVSHKNAVLNNLRFELIDLAELKCVAQDYADAHIAAIDAALHLEAE